MLRVLLKVSGEYLGGKKGFGFDDEIIQELASQIQEIQLQGFQIAVVLGGGNFFRGGKQIKVIRTAGDNIGMLATVMNAIYLQAGLENKGINTRLMTSILMNQLAEPYIPRKAIRHLEKNRVIILGAGLGIPHFSTDTASAVRAKEIEADIIIKGTKVDGVFDKDPIKHDNAKKFFFLTYDEVLKKELTILDETAVTFAKEQKIPIYVLNIIKKNNLVNFFKKKYLGTFIAEKKSEDIIEDITLKNITKKYSKK